MEEKKTIKENLQTYIYAGLPILYIDTFEDDRAEKIIYDLAKKNGREVATWSLRGFQSKPGVSPVPGDLAKRLNMLLADPQETSRKILILKDIASVLDLPDVVARLKFMAQQINEENLEDFTIIIIAPLMTIPHDIESYVTIVDLDYLDDSAIHALIRDFAEKQEIPVPSDDLMGKFSTALRGLSETDILTALSLSVADDGRLDATDLKVIRDQKKQIIKKSGILEIIDVNETLDDIGGLENLKTWLKRKAELCADINKANNFGVATPKGVLIVGMPGCGKSLTAKAAQKVFDIPLLRMDMGRLMGKYVGESEGNMRRAIKLTEASSPCILWIDELEKAFAGIGSDSSGSEVTVRLFGSFLTWMQEKKGLAFVIATANKIEKLPPELLRKGRFDEIFYVEMPNETERQKIFEIHIGKKHAEDLEKIDLQKIVKKTKGYCGADIESVVHESLEEAFLRDSKNHQQPLTTEILLETIENTHPISETMKGQIEKMRETYKDLKFKSASK